MKNKVNVHEAKTSFSKLLKRVMAGEEIIIAMDGKPVARLIPLAAPTQPRQPGLATGKIQLSADFDLPLPDDVLASFEA